MIIWLASYPKSGNTWIRLFLNSLIFSQENKVDINNINIRQFPIKRDFRDLSSNIEDIKEFVENCIHAQSRLNLDNKVKILKTHNALWKTEKHSFTNYENTLGVIHIVRDPRNVITSIKNHYGKNNYNEALEFLKNEKKMIGKKDSKEEYDLPTIISSWNNHYNSWKKFKKNYLLIQYENLLSRPLNEFKKITNFLENCSNFKFHEKEILRAIENCNFEDLKNQEKKSGFRESPKDKSKKFFFLGPNNDWEKLLDKEIKKKIEFAFEKEMKELKYI